MTVTFHSGTQESLFLFRISDLLLKRLGKGCTVDIGDEFVVEVLDYTWPSTLIPGSQPIVD